MIEGRIIMIPNFNNTLGFNTMKWIRLVLIGILFLLREAPTFSQSINSVGVPFRFDAANCLDELEKVQIKSKLKINVDSLKLLNKIGNGGLRQATNFIWPLRKSSALKWDGYSFITNFVDQNVNTGILDYNCLSRTYDGHNGTDIAIWPFPWYLVDNDLIEVVAAAEGTIIGKDDGNDHSSCAVNPNQWNAVYIIHSDGSVAWYGHLKKNSLTTKSVGATVAQGEYLGVVASSGNSTGPHLHFEVYASSTFNRTNLIDPFSGTCNSLNPNSWWSNQLAYENPQILTIQTHDALPILSCPSLNEIPNFQDSFQVGQTIFLIKYMKQIPLGSVIHHSIIKPNGSIWIQWDQTIANYYDLSYWYNDFTIPNDQSGNWKFRVEFQSQDLIDSFYIIPITTMISAKAILGGPYNPLGDTMSTSLRTMSMLPTKCPYDTTNTLNVLPLNMIDWVRTDLVDTLTGDTLYGSQCACLLKTGSIQNISGDTTLSFAGVTPPYISIRIKHRNHLSVRSRGIPNTPGVPISFDFRLGTNLYIDPTITGSAYYNIGQPEMLTSSGRYALWPGDANGDGQIKYQGSVNDRGLILSAIGGSVITNTISGYHPADVNLNGQVKYQGSGNDRGIVLSSIGGSVITKVSKAHD